MSIFNLLVYYKAYRNLYLGKGSTTFFKWLKCVFAYLYKPPDIFVNNLTKILVDLYDNKEFSVFFIYNFL